MQENNTSAQDHDIAIIQLAQPVQFSDSVAPVSSELVLKLSSIHSHYLYHAKPGVLAPLLLVELRRGDGNGNWLGNPLQRRLPTLNPAGGT